MDLDHYVWLQILVIRTVVDKRIHLHVNHLMSQTFTDVH